MHAPPRTSPRIGIALGSGGARGWAHLGVLRRLDAFGVRPSCVAGTSIGAIVAALYACGALDTMEALGARLDWKRLAQLFFEVTLPRSGLISGKHFMRLLKDIIPARNIADLPFPYAAVATDLHTEKEVVLSSGNLFDAIRASIGIPGIFTPTRLEGQTLVDGGLVNPLPVSVCRAMGAEIVIAVDVNLRTPPLRPRRAPRKPAGAPSPRIDALIASVSRLMPDTLHTPMRELARRWTDPRKNAADPLSIFDVLTRTMRLVENQITRRELALNPPDLLIQPEVGDLLTLEFHRSPEGIAAGIRAADEQRSRIEALLRPRHTLP
ncbi:MAG: patatin-like phospholipase family protein [Kiritimatiellia bacterium]|jgi:NTE family protein|nr:patatin-like phospholipase family protein [Kiritimatiellia bacterium]